MEPVDLIALAKTSYSNRNTHLARTSVLPVCAKRHYISRGPTLSAICDAPANTVPYDLGGLLKLRREDRNPLIEDHIPLMFTLDAGLVRHEERLTFPVMVYVRSIDLLPDLTSAHWSVFGKKGKFDRCPILIRGWLSSMPNNEHTPKHLKCGDVSECVIVYYPQSGEGYLGEVAKVQTLPTSGVIKDLSVLHEIVYHHYRGGFVEVNAPDGETHWGHLVGHLHAGRFRCDALWSNGVPWRFCPSKDHWSIDVVGTRHEENGYELLGDAFLCSDGTIRHMYHFARADYPELHHRSQWKDGEYMNRFYPPGSPMIPEHIRTSFEREMPAWFYKESEGDKKALAPSA